MRKVPASHASELEDNGLESRTIRTVKLVSFGQIGTVAGNHVTVCTLIRISPRNPLEGVADTRMGLAPPPGHRTRWFSKREFTYALATA